MGTRTPGGFDMDTEILSDVGFIKFSEFDKLLYKVATLEAGKFTYQKVIAYSCEKYVGDSVSISTMYGDLVLNPNTKLATSRGIVAVGTLVGAPCSILSSAPEPNSKFISRIKRKYDYTEHAYRLRIKMPSLGAASTLQAKATLAGYATTTSQRTVVIRTLRRYVRVVTADFTPTSHDVWSVFVETPGSMIFIRKCGVVFVVCAD